MSPSAKPMRLIAGNSNPGLWQEISEQLGIPLTITQVTRFSDGEIRIKVDESVRETHCFILQSTCNPVNEHLMELLLLIDALRRASAYRIGVVTPYYGYARQDKKIAPREPISARLVANLIEQTGADRLLAMDLHSNAIQGFFNIPVDHLTAANVLCDYMFNDGWAEKDCVVVSPDVGGVERASYVADRLNLPIAIIAKRRPEPNVSEVVEVVGDVRGAPRDHVRRHDRHRGQHPQRRDPADAGRREGRARLRGARHLQRQRDQEYPRQPDRPRDGDQHHPQAPGDQHPADPLYQRGAAASPRPSAATISASASAACSGSPCTATRDTWRSALISERV